MIESLQRSLRGPSRTFAMEVGAAALAIFVFVGILYPAPLSILFLGLVLGSLSALVAMGLVLVYRANRIVNFAQGDLGALAAVLAASLIVGPKWSFWPAVAVGLLVALILGGATEVLVIRRFARAPRLLLSVATIGLAQLFAFGQLYLPKLFDYDTAPQPPVPFEFSFEWFPVVFGAGHLLILLVVPVLAVGLALFFRRTRFGIAVRASAESSDRASLLGIPVKNLGTLVWVLAAGMSGLGTLLRLPIQGVAIGSVLGPSLLLRALAAAVIGRMENLWVTFGAALALGVVEQAVFYETNRTVVVDGVLFGVIVVALLLQRRGSEARADDTNTSTWTATREVRPVPRELRSLPIVRYAYLVAALGAATLLVVLPLSWSGSRVNLFGVALIFAMVTISMVVLTGWAGQISLGHLAITAFGAAVAGSLAQQGKHFFVCVLAAGVVGTLIAMVVGVPALRIRGPFLAVTTLAFAVATGTYFLNDEFFPWLYPDSSTRIIRPVLFGKFDLESEHTWYFVLLGAFAMVAVSVAAMRRTRTGRILIAVRDNPRAAQSYGVSPTRARLTAFGLSGFIAGAAGSLYVFHLHDLGRTVLEAESNLKIFSMAVIGGLGSVPGAILGAGYLAFVDYSSFTAREESRLLASSVGVLLILLVLPGGLGGLAYDLRDRLLRIVARRRGIVVPSLLADTRTVEADVVPLESAAGSVPREGATTPEDALLVVRDLEVSYGRTQVLFGVDLHVERGEILALLGTNGAGKSTLLSAISGLLTPDGGTITFDGRDITRDGANATVSAGIVLMPGGKGVFPTLTVAENIALAGWLLAKEPERQRALTDEALEMFPILRDRWRQKAGNLSGGEQQMLTLAQAFIARPELLMIDELSLGLAPIVVEQLLEIVRAIHARGTTVVIVEQSVNLACTLAQRAVFLEKGEVRFDGPTAELLERPDILRAVFLQGTAGVKNGARRPAIAGTDRSAPTYTPVCTACGHEHRVALEARELAINFGGVRAVNGVDLDVRQGQILGIIGANGAGKTTVFDLISGYLQPTSGRIALNGTDVTALSADGRASLGLGRSFQDARLFPSLTVRDAIAVALERHISVRDPIATALLSPAVKVAEREVTAKVDELIELMSLGAFADKFVGELSTGTRRIVDLACSLAHRPDVLLLDEPSSGIAQRETEALGPVLLDIRDRTGAALIVIEHDMPLITGISDELIALELGAVVARGAPAAVLADPRVVAGYLGGDVSAVQRSGTPKRPPRPKRTPAGVA